MSATAHKRTSPTGAACAQCGAPLADDQEWCLECGTARTVIHEAPEWRIPVAIAGGLVALMAAGAVLALVVASNDVNRKAVFQPTRASAVTSSPAVGAAPATPGATTTPAVAPTAPNTPTVARGAGDHAGAAAPERRTTAAAPTRLSARRDKSGITIAGWPARLGGWTVILTVNTTRAAAEGWARSIGARGIPVGVLKSSQHRSLTPGFWIVFSGRYPTGAAARLAARKLLAEGEPLAHAHMVAPPRG